VRLTRERYRELVREDSALLATAARNGLDAEVPPCPGWVVRDVVGHTSAVHRQKESIVRLRVQARTETPDLEAPPGDDGLIAWFEQGVEQLLATLDVAQDIPVYTWYPADQTTGFWQRRMAHETAIHRADAQSAHGDISPIDAALAADGVDEILGHIMCGYTDDPAFEFVANGRLLVIHMTDVAESRTLIMGDGKYGPGWILEEGATQDADTVLSGTASNLDLWAWGRAPIEALEIEGGAGLVNRVRKVAADATQ